MSPKPKPQPDKPAATGDDEKQRFRFPRLLALATPRMRDGDLVQPDGDPVEDVSKAQQLLFRNRWRDANGEDPEDGGGEFYFADEPQHRDEGGLFGAETAAACRRARRWLGYPKSGKNGWRRGRFDDRLAAYLLPIEDGGEKLRPLYRRRRRRRIKAAQNSLGKKALAYGRKQIGEHETPDGSNRTQTTNWWGYAAAWCLMFASRCYILGAKSKSFKRGSRYAYNPTLYHAAKAHVDGLELVPLSKAKPGDICQWDWNNGTEPPDHGSLFIRVVGNDVETLDGNWDDRVGIFRHPKSALMSIVRVTE